MRVLALTVLVVATAVACAEGVSPPSAAAAGAANGGGSGGGAASGAAGTGGLGTGGVGTGGLATGGTSTGGVGTGGATGGVPNTGAVSCVPPKETDLSLSTSTWKADGGNLSVRALPSVAVPSAEIELRFCFSLISASPTVSAPPLRFDDSRATGLPKAPYDTKLTLVGTVTPAGSGFCASFPISPAGAVIEQNGELKITWTLDTSGLAEGMLDPRPGVAPFWAVYRNGKLSTCASMK